MTSNEDEFYMIIADPDEISIFLILSFLDVKMLKK
jgi:hypothetical protein